jgi:hypothetical protein
MCLLVLADPQNARLAMMRLYAGPKGSEEEGNPVKRARAAGLKQDTDHCEKCPRPPLSKGVKKRWCFAKGDTNEE